MDPRANHWMDGVQPILIQGLMTTECMKLLSAYWQCPWIPCPLTSFPCGEWQVHALSSLAQKSVYIVHDLGPWQRDAWMALGLLVESATASQAQNIHLMVPYLPYGRQNTGKNGPGLNVFGHLLQALSIHQLITLDPHDVGYGRDWCVHTQSLIGAHIFYSQWSAEDPMDWIISPDLGGSIRAQQFSEKWHCPWTPLAKTRTTTGMHMHHPDPTIFFQKNCLIVDDIVDTGHTLAETVAYLRASGAHKLSACITHGLFSNGCLDRLESSGLNDLWVTDSVPVWAATSNATLYGPSTSTLDSLAHSRRHGSLQIHRVPWAHVYGA